MPQKIKPNDSFAYEVLPVVEEISAGWLAHLVRRIDAQNCAVLPWKNR